MEKIELTDPVVKPALTSYQVARLSMDWASLVIDILVVSDTGESQAFTYSGTDAAAMMKALNTANLSQKSLHRRVMERLVADGHISGTISGVPE